MNISSKHVNGMVIGFFLIIIVVVFHQIATSMTEQGIASGTPYDNAAAYPRAVAVLIGVLLLLQTIVSLVTRQRHVENSNASVSELYKPAALLILFGVYLGLLGTLGYHLTTTPMIMGTMWLCEVRRIFTLLVSGLCISFVFAFLFEYFLKIVLPGGVFSLNIPW